MSFSSFIIDEEEGNKKLKKVYQTVKKAVKKCLVDEQQSENAYIVSFKTEGYTAGGSTMKPTVFEVAITLDYYKQVYRGIHRAIYINIVRETNNSRTTDYIQLDLSVMTEDMFLKALSDLKCKFEDLCCLKK